MGRRAAVSAILLFAVMAAAGAWWLTAPRTIAASAIPARAADVENGRTVFHASGCGSCHATPGQDDLTRLGGGHGLESPFGTFYAPNISPHPEAGIGSWTEVQFVNAVLRGVSPGGSHYYPAFPYASYAAMRIEDVQDLFAFLKTLPAQADASRDNDIGFPYSIRRGIGLWKWRYAGTEPFRADPARSAQWNRGAYLVEVLGHCAECHSPRDALGGIRPGMRFAGGPAMDGQGQVPNITSHEDGIGDWTEEDLAFVLEDGFTPDGDSLGGDMAPVIRNLAMLTPEDRQAMAHYLMSLRPLPSAPED